MLNKKLFIDKLIKNTYTLYRNGKYFHTEKGKVVERQWRKAKGSTASAKTASYQDVYPGFFIA